MKPPTSEEIQKLFPKLSTDEHLAVCELVSMFPDIDSFPDKRLEYEATILAKEHLCSRGMRGLNEKASFLVAMARQLIPVHETHRDTHPYGNVAFDDGDGYKSNPFIRFSPGGEVIVVSPKDNERWTKAWRAREFEVTGSNKGRRPHSSNRSTDARNDRPKKSENDG